MAGARITKRLVDSLTATGREHYAWDADLPGFGVRVRAEGAKSYVVTYRAGTGRGAPVRKVTLGAVAKLTPDEARALARRTLAAVAQGEDPAAAKAEAREALTVAALIDLFLAEHVEAKRKPSTAVFYRDLLNRLVRPELGKMRAEAIPASAVARLHLKLKATPYQANRVLAVLASMYAFGVKRKLVPEGTNPARGVELYREEGRERFLTAEELERLGAAIREAESGGVPWSIDRTGPKAKHAPKGEPRTTISPFAAAALRLLLFTGARLREVLHLRWEHVDLGRGLLFLPDSKTGKKTIVLGAPALQVLAGLPRVGAYVIAGDDPDRPRSDLKRPWAVVSRRAGLDGVRLHDLRHSFASVGAGASFGLPVLGKLLGHAQTRTTQRYAHLDADPLRRASTMIAEHIAGAMGERTMGETQAAGGGEVVPLHRSRA